MKDKVVAIFCSDLHLCLRAPAARAGEKSWEEAMMRPLAELHNLKHEYDVPIFCAGDIFDRWNSPPELINFALAALPEMYVIPGQHDLPLHNIQLIKKSAFWTLVESGKAIMMYPGVPYPVFGDGFTFDVYGFQWGNKIEKPEEHNEGHINIAVSHQYVWVDGYSYPTAPEEGKLTKARKELRDFDVAVFGDNHKGFITKCGDTTVINCGGFMKMKSDEGDYMPQVGLLYNSGKIEPYFLDTTEDIFVPVESKKEIEEDLELREFIEGLNQLEEMGLDFREAMIRVLDKKKPSQAVIEIILRAMEK